MVQLLIAKGADVNKANDKKGKTVIMAAVEDGNIEIIKLLLKNLAKIGNVEDDVWQKVFKIANDQNKTEGVKYIKEFQNHQGLMPLLYQSKVGKDEKKRWPTDLIRKAHHTLTGNDALDPKKPEKPQ